MLGFASLITLGVIVGFVFVIALLVAYFMGTVDMGVVILLTVVFNVLSWLISPFFMDLMFKWFYKIKRVSIEELGARRKPLADFIVAVCARHKMKLPMLRIIEDDNPTAFAFGSGIFNARLCFSEGLFTYLDEDEIEAVIAHELGHIHHRDFIIMTIASTAIQILYELSQLLLRRSRKNDKKNVAVWIGFLSYIFYFIGTYLLLFLSRAREYHADKFSAHETANPDALARALVKVAYGIVARPDGVHQERLLHATRALAPYDSEAARHLGTAFASSKNDWGLIRQVIAFDLISPWAKILQLQSTHPLTGKRILRLNEMSKNQGKKVSIETDSITMMPVDRHRLYSGFGVGVLVHFLPWIAPIGVLLTSFAISLSGPGYEETRVFLWIPASMGIAQLIKILYKYPRTTPTKATTLDMLTDVYASPVRGTMYALEGTVIGRGVAGAQFSEDLMIQDGKGLIYLNYESAFSFIGNLIFALGKVRKMIGAPVQAVGWFFRGVGHHLDLDQITAQGKTTHSYPRLLGVIFSVASVVFSYYLFLTYEF